MIHKKKYKRDDFKYIFIALLQIYSMMKLYASNWFLLKIILYEYMSNSAENLKLT